MATSWSRTPADNSTWVCSTGSRGRRGPPLPEHNAPPPEPPNGPRPLLELCLVPPAPSPCLQTEAASSL
ncbi:hypothetical protein NQZ68_003902 [Dissostichus eleginoides]|nr:hypothetical protein NQZ68_003902 [Dissostichus eleginoides]